MNVKIVYINDQPLPRCPIDFLRQQHVRGKLQILNCGGETSKAVCLIVFKILVHHYVAFTYIQD